MEVRVRLKIVMRTRIYLLQKKRILAKGHDFGWMMMNQWIYFKGLL